jgi:hypothetical protein
MPQGILRAALVALVSAALAAACVAAAFGLRSELVLEMDRELPRGMSTGLYGVERAGLETFAWTAARADFVFSGLSRRDPWTCTVRLRGGRADPIPQPGVEILIDGIRGATVPATNDYQDIAVDIPPRPSRPGLVLSIASSPTMIPGPDDRRELGVQLDRLACAPRAATIPWPPRAALDAAMLSAAAVGAALVGTGIGVPAAIGAAGCLAFVQAWALSSGVASYSAYPAVAVRLALVLALIGFAAVRLLELARRQPLTGAARFVVLFTVGVLYVKLLGLLHPSKLIIDAVFHAHRFQAVLAGHYYFTQQMPGGVSFPYAIALYLFAAPWASLTNDYVTLLRIVVSTSEAMAGALLYVAIVRAWGDRLAGALAVVLFHLVPLPWGLIGNANMTNAFGQAVALMAVIAAALFQPRRPLQLAGLFVVAAVAFLAHISTAALLGVTLVAAGILYRLVGDRSLHGAAWGVLGMTAAAALFSIVIYYGHFAEVYRTLERVRPAAAAQDAVIEPTRPAPGSPTAAPTPLPVRAGQALWLSAVVTGWPIVGLAAVGMWRVWRTRTADRLVLALAAWAAAYVTFFGIGILPRVDTQFERYAAEFVGRAVFATYPAAVVLAAAGAAWGLRSAFVAVRFGSP